MMISAKELTGYGPEDGGKGRQSLKTRSIISAKVGEDREDG